jgi:Capsular polysaccharide biosynthesis protein
VGGFEVFVDIHSHIIPHIDDGAIDIKMSLDMLRLASQNGTIHIVATPHYITGETRYSPGVITNMCEEIQKKAILEGISIKIHPGSEIYMCPELLELYDSGDICTINNSLYILVELPLVGIPLYMNDVLYELQLKGLKPIIAHPERNSNIIKDPDILLNLVQRGILAQANARSIDGLYGKKIQKLVMKFIRRGLIYFIASDAHSCKRRSPGLNNAFLHIERVFGKDIANRLFYENGLRVLENSIVPLNQTVESNINIFKRLLK